MNRQTLFDTAVMHLFRQGRASISSTTKGNRVRYRTKAGLADPIGAVLDDSVYTPAMEDIRIDTIAQIAEGAQTSDKLDQTTAKTIIKALGGGRNLPILSDLQHVHDIISIDHKSWRRDIGRGRPAVKALRDRLVGVARDHNLRFKHLPDLVAAA